jgi:UPF0755 protein
MTKKTKVYIAIGMLIIVASVVSLLSLGFLCKIQVEGESKVIFIHSNMSSDEIQKELGVQSFPWNCALVFKRNPTLKPGKYTFKSGLTYYEVINLLRNGEQTPVKFRTDNVNSIYELAGKFGTHFEQDSTAFLIAANEIIHELEYLNHLENSPFQLQGLAAFINGDSYEFKWTDTPKEFLQKFIQDRNQFWNEERKIQCNAQGITPFEATVLASIVCGEIRDMNEGPRVAGLYLNRLKQGILLQSDPTVIFALNTREKIQRLSNNDLKIDSPYNTYKYKGLPPAPIRFVNEKYIDFVLHAESNEFIFMVAEAGGTGKHKFSKTYAEHQKYAQEYWDYLNSKNIHR